MSKKVPNPKELRKNDLRHTLNRVRTSVKDAGPPARWQRAGVIMVILAVVFSTTPGYAHAESEVDHPKPQDFNQIEDPDTYWLITRSMSDRFGDPASRSIFYLVDGKIVDNHGLLTDAVNYTAIATPNRESSGWISDGAPSITFADGVWYATHRQRTGNSNRGHYLIVDRSTDLVNWSNVWKVSTGDVSPAYLRSFERAAVRLYEDSYFLYFCADIGGTWKSYYVKARTVAGLETKLENSASWSVIVPGAKDPNTFFHQGTYYFITSDGLYEDDNPEGTSVEFIVDFTQLYKDAYGGDAGNPGNNTGTIMFDTTSGYFIYWRGVKVSWNDDEVDDLVWFFATSPDLKRWTARDRHIVHLDYPLSSGSLRYQDYFANDTTEAVVMEWEADLGLGYRSVILWDYPRPTMNVITRVPPDTGEDRFDRSKTDTFQVEKNVSDITTIPEFPSNITIHRMGRNMDDGRIFTNLEPSIHYLTPGGERNVTIPAMVETTGPVEIPWLVASAYIIPVLPLLSRTFRQLDICPCERGQPSARRLGSPLHPRAARHLELLYLRL